MNPRPPSRSSKDYLLPFLIIVSIGIIAALLIRLLGIMGEDESSSLALSGKAELSAVTGSIEVYLPAAQAWKITTEAASLNPGEMVRSDADSSAVLTFEDGSVVQLGNSSELQIVDLRNSISKKEVSLKLAKGAALIDAGTLNANLEIATAFLKLKNPDGKFLISTDKKGDTATAVSGGFTATVLDPQNSNNPELKNFVVETGQTLEISERRVNLLRIGGEIDLVKTTPAEILNSKNYLALIGTAAETTESANLSEEALNPDEITTDAERNTLPAPLVVTGNGNITAVTEPVKVTGKVSPKIAKVEVSAGDGEAFALSRFEAGSGEWSYNAAIDFGNLKIGVNNFTVVGYDTEGNKTPPANFQIIFNPEGVDETVAEAAETPETTTPAITETDGIPQIGGETFGLPEVIEPLDGATFTTAPVHFEGKVPVGTKEILVNEYKLSSFTEGETSWIYNADPKYENLEVGENEFEIVAVSETGDRSSLTIKITFTPEEVATEE